MKKMFVLGLIMNLMAAGTAYADMLPEGKKIIPVCAYFNNTAEFLDSLAIYGFETGPDAERTDLSQYIADECFITSYKFNDFGVYAVTAEHAATLDLETYDPRDDEESYMTDIEPAIGYLVIDEDDPRDSVSNEYTIIGLDIEEGVLDIEPVKTTTYFSDESDPEVTEGEVLDIRGIEEDNIFTDVAIGNKYYDALSYLKIFGIIEGYPDGSFKPDATINRAEFTKIILESIMSSEAIESCSEYDSVEEGDKIALFTDVTFTVGGNEPEWYFDYVCEAKRSGIVEGYPDGSFMPDRDINFAEGAKIVVEALDYLDWQTTVPSEPWYMNYVKELESRNAIPTSIASFGQKITRGEMAEIMYRLKAEITDRESLTYEDLL